MRDCEATEAAPGVGSTVDSLFAGLLAFPVLASPSSVKDEARQPVEPLDDDATWEGVLYLGYAYGREQLVKTPPRVELLF